MEAIEKKHIDGTWFTSESFYKSYKIEIKSQKGKGIKAHVWDINTNKVIFTRRYSFIEPSLLLERVKVKINQLTKN